MKIELTDVECRDLVEVIDARRRELQNELVHTDDRAYRQELRAVVERLEALEARLAQANPSPSA